MGEKMIPGLEVRREAERLNTAGTAALRSKDFNKAAELFEQALEKDIFASQHDWDLLSETPAVFRQRIKLRNLIMLRLGDMARAAKKHHAGYVPDPSWKPRIFVYWGQGFESAPDMVKFCHAELLRLHGVDEVVTLTDENLSEWIELPIDLREKLGENRTAFSDVLRLELLAKHGGIWVDATCLPTANLLEHFSYLTKESGFFAFNNGRLFSSWFMASAPDSYLTRLTLECIRLYWRVFDKPIMYYYLHHTFRFVHTLDSRANQLWGKAPRTEYDPRTFGRILTQPAEKHDGAQVAGRSIVHKLTYKIKEEMRGPGTVYAELLAGRFIAN